MERIVEPDEIILSVEHRQMTDEEGRAMHEAIARSKRQRTEEGSKDAAGRDPNPLDHEPAE